LFPLCKPHKVCLSSFEIETLNDYLASDNLLETRTNTGLQNSSFIIGKLKLRSKPNNDTDITLGSYIKTSNNQSNSNITITDQNSNIIEANLEAENISFRCTMVQTVQ